MGNFENPGLNVIETGPKKIDKKPTVYELDADGYLVSKNEKGVIETSSEKDNIKPIVYELNTSGYVVPKEKHLGNSKHIEGKKLCGDEIDGLIKPDLGKIPENIMKNLGGKDIKLDIKRPNDGNMQSRVSVGGKEYNGQNGYSDGNGVKLGGINID